MALLTFIRQPGSSIRNRKIKSHPFTIFKDQYIHLPAIVLGLFSRLFMVVPEAEDAVDTQVLFFALTPLVIVTPPPPAIPAKRSSLLLV